VSVTQGRFGHARVAVLSVIEEETQAVHEVFGLTQRVQGKPYFVAADVDPQRPPVVNREVGRTNLQSGGCIRDVIEHWRAEALVLCGIAGGLGTHEEINICDIVIPDYVHYCSFSKLSEGGQQRRYIPYDHPSLSLHSNYAAPLRNDISWITPAVRHLLPDNRLPRVLIGGLVAGDKVYGDPTNEEQIKIVDEFDDAIAIDMESVGLCRAVADARRSPLYNPRLLIIRSISDLVGDVANNQQRSQNKRAAAMVAAVFAHRVVSDIIENEPDPRPRRRRS
jgi:nucleoside phosphorylase